MFWVSLSCLWCHRGLPAPISSHRPLLCHLGFFPSHPFPSLFFSFLLFSSLFFSSLLFSSLPFPSLLFPSLPFPSLLFSSLLFSSHPLPCPSELQRDVTVSCKRPCCLCPNCLMETGMISPHDLRFAYPLTPSPLPPLFLLPSICSLLLQRAAKVCARVCLVVAVFHYVSLALLKCLFVKLTQDGFACGSLFFFTGYFKAATRDVMQVSPWLHSRMLVGAGVADGGPLPHSCFLVRDADCVPTNCNTGCDESCVRNLDCDGMCVYQCLHICPCVCICVCAYLCAYLSLSLSACGVCVCVCVSKVPLPYICKRPCFDKHRFKRPT